ncbi:MAG: hypothetical protein RLZZ111_497 [Planctomycetota bacterium]|jgi:hypothetical protein
MRRSLQSFIVALLCLTLGIDSAKACWLWRHRCRPAVSRHAVCPPAALPPAHECAVPVAQPGWAAVASGETLPGVCCGDEHPEATVVPAEAHTIVTDGCGCQVECCRAEDASVEVIAETSDVAVAEQVVPETGAAAPTRDDASVVVHGPTVVVDSSPAGPTAEPATAQPLLPVPEPVTTSVVKPASGEQPAAGPAAAPSAEKTAEQPADKPAELLVMPTVPAATAEAAAAAPVASAASLAVAPPPRPNLFDLYADAEEPAAAPVEPAASPVAEPEEPPPAAEPAMKKEAPAAEIEKPAEEAPPPAADSVPPASEPAEPAAEEPAAKPAEADAAPEQDAEAADATAHTVPNEPQRLWTDASGAHRARGWLVAVGADRVRILKANGRHTTVAIAMLSAPDRDYVAEVTTRLAARQPTVSGPDDIAGL